MTRLRVFMALAVGFVALVWWTLGRENQAIDRCLDAGHRWDFDTESCDG